MNFTYDKITPDQVWVSFLPVGAQGEEHSGMAVNEYGNRPTNNSFIDLFAGLIKQHGWHDAIFYARLMNLSPAALGYTVQTLTGVTAKEWISEFVMRAARELLTETDLTLGQIASKLSFTQLCPFSNLFLRYEKMRPKDWRSIHKK